MKNKVGIIMGSDSDLSIMKGAADVLKQFDIDFEITICSAHRTPDRALEYAKTAKKRGLSAIIAGAGMAAHLPGVLAALTTLPVIGVPMKSGALSGVDALYAIVQMPPGIPVATVSIDGAKNAGILAAKIIGASDSAVSAKLEEYMQEMAKGVNEKAEKLEKLGYEEYLKQMK